MTQGDWELQAGMRILLAMLGSEDWSSQVFVNVRATDAAKGNLDAYFRRSAVSVVKASVPVIALTSVRQDYGENEVSILRRNLFDFEFLLSVVADSLDCGHGVLMRSWISEATEQHEIR